MQDKCTFILQILIECQCHNSVHKNKVQLEYGNTTYSKGKARKRHRTEKTQNKAP